MAEGSAQPLGLAAGRSGPLGPRGVVAAVGDAGAGLGRPGLHAAPRAADLAGDETHRHLGAGIPDRAGERGSGGASPLCPSRKGEPEGLPSPHRCTRSPPRWSMGPSPSDAEHLRPTFVAAALQGNIDQNVTQDPAYAARVTRTFTAQSREAAAAGRKLVVWPETAFPGYLSETTPGAAGVAAEAVRDRSDAAGRRRRV